MAFFPGGYHKRRSVIAHACKNCSSSGEKALRRSLSTSIVPITSESHPPIVASAPNQFRRFLPQRSVAAIRKQSQAFQSLLLHGRILSEPHGTRSLAKQSPRVLIVSSMRPPPNRLAGSADLSKQAVVGVRNPKQWWAGRMSADAFNHHQVGASSIFDRQQHPRLIRREGQLE